MSQSQCGRTPSQAGYRSSPWWAITPPKLIGRGLLLERQVLRSPALIGESGDPPILCGISPSFPGLSPTQGQITHVLLTRLPLTESCPSARTTCMC